MNMAGWSPPTWFSKGIASKNWGLGNYSDTLPETNIQGPWNSKGLEAEIYEISFNGNGLCSVYLTPTGW